MRRGIKDRWRASRMSSPSFRSPPLPAPPFTAILIVQEFHPAIFIQPLHPSAGPDTLPQPDTPRRSATPRNHSKPTSDHPQPKSPPHSTPLQNVQVGDHAIPMQTLGHGSPPTQQMRKTAGNLSPCRREICHDPLSRRSRLPAVLDSSWQGAYGGLQVIEVV